MLCYNSSFNSRDVVWVFLSSSHIRWFCDLSLRRFAKTLSRGHYSARSVFVYQSRADIEGDAVNSSSSWGFASSQAASLGFREHFSEEACGAGAAMMSDAIQTGWRTAADHGRNDLSKVKASPRFRMFKLICSQTAVTEKGARTAEALSPGLLVVTNVRPVGDELYL